MSGSVPLAAYKQTLLLNKRLVYVVFFLVFALICAVVPYSFLFPLKEKQLEFVEFKSGTNNFVTIAKAGKEFTNKQLLISMFLRQYIVDREKVDKTTETIRYQRVLAFSGDSLKANFRQTHGGKKSNFHRKNFKRDIELKRDDALDYGLHQIEFVTIDTKDNKQSLSDTLKNRRASKQEWVATMEYIFDGQEVSFDEKHLNPLGLKVMQYSLSRRKK